MPLVKIVKVLLADVFCAFLRLSELLNLFLRAQALGKGCQMFCKLKLTNEENVLQEMLVSLKIVPGLLLCSIPFSEVRLEDWVNI